MFNIKILKYLFYIHGKKFKEILESRSATLKRQHKRRQKFASNDIVVAVSWSEASCGIAFSFEDIWSCNCICFERLPFRKHCNVAAQLSPSTGRVKLRPLPVLMPVATELALT